MKNIDWKNIFKKKTILENPGSVVAWPVNYIRDWKLVVSIFALILISLSIFAWQIYLSNQIAGGYLSPIIEITDVSVKTVDIKKLQNNLLLLETKQIDFLKLKANQAKTVDPSL